MPQYACGHGIQQKNEKLDAATLGGTHTVMRDRRHILNRRHTNAERIESANRGFAAGTGAPNADFDVLKTVFKSSLASDVRSNLSSERGGLTGTLEALSAGGRRRNGVALAVSDRDDRVVEGLQ